MPFKDQTKAKESTKERVGRYRSRHRALQGNVTPHQGVTPTIPVQFPATIPVNLFWFKYGGRDLQEIYDEVGVEVWEQEVAKEVTRQKTKVRTGIYYNSLLRKE